MLLDKLYHIGMAITIYFLMVERCMSGSIGSTPSEHKKSGNLSRSPLDTVFPNINQAPTLTLSGVVTVSKNVAAPACVDGIVTYFAGAFLPVNWNSVAVYTEVNVYCTVLLSVLFAFVL